MLIEDLRYFALKHLRYEKQFPIVGMEVDWSPGVGYVMADVMGISKNGLLYEIEIKVSLGDLYADAGKERKHECLSKTFQRQAPTNCQEDPFSNLWRVPARFYYLVPGSIAAAAQKHIKESVPYAGLMVYSLGLGVRKFAPKLHSQIVPN